MNEFEQRWRRMVRAAGRDEGPLPELSEPLLATWSRRRRGGRAGVPVVDEWIWFGLRGLAVSAVLLALCTWWTFQGGRERPLVRPPIENVVAETFWLL